jgi:hypothetical protein
MRIYRGRFVRDFDDGPRLMLREADPKAFRDALAIRWAGVGVFIVAGVVCAVVQWLGISD